MLPRCIVKALSPVAQALTLWLSLAVLLAACGESPTVKQITRFADRICACKDVDCTQKVDVDYVEWGKGQKRARGTGDDRKEVEKAMERYSECHLALVGPDNKSKPVAPVPPKVNLAPPATTAARGPIRAAAVPPGEASAPNPSLAPKAAGAGAGETNGQTP